MVNKAEIQGQLTAEQMFQREQGESRWEKSPGEKGICFWDWAKESRMGGRKDWWV